MSLMKKSTAIFGEEDILQVYEFDRKAVIKYETELARAWSWCVFIHPLSWVCLPCVCYQNFCLLEENTRDRVNATHVALTRDGIKYVVEQHNSGCRFDCEDKGKVSKTISYRKITDCDVQEPAGKSGPWCCMVKNTLSVVNIDTASSGGTDEQGRKQYELSIGGLTDPNGFKRDVWAQIRGEYNGGGDSGYGGGVPVASAAIMERGAAKSVLQRMEELQELRDKGFISEAEYSEKRGQILSDA